MKFVTLAFASALAAVFATAQPTLAQSYDQSAGGSDQSPSYKNVQDRQHDDWRRDNDRDDWTSRPSWRRNERKESRWGPPMGRRGGQRWAKGARFRFRRGNARIDIQCPADVNVEQCVRAASQLIDTIKGLNASSDKTESKPGATGTTPGKGAPGNRT